jgi:hypothetical protein
MPLRSAASGSIIMAAIPITKRGGRTSGALSPARIAASVARPVQTSWRARDDRAAFAFIAVPLAMIATALTGLWWAWIPLTVMACVAMPSWRLAAAMALQEGYVGAAWAYVGATWLGEYPYEQLSIALLWLAFPCAMAIAGHVARSRTAHGE